MGESIENRDLQMGGTRHQASGQMAPELGFKCPNVNGLDERWKGGMYDSKLTPYLR